jgi:single-stranded-DNA-specific exonuclease
MKFRLLNDEKDKPLIERLFAVRNISDDPDSFIHAKLADYWIDPYKLNDMNKAVERILLAFKNKERIMIFGDYDVDGVTSSYTLYHFFKDRLNYPSVSIQYPDRRLDGYGLKNKHLDMMKEKNIDLVITVDNGITSIGEADYAKEIGIDLIITDHHHALETIPDALAVVNPQVSPEYSFKGLACV